MHELSHYLLINMFAGCCCCCYCRLSSELRVRSRKETRMSSIVSTDFHYIYYCFLSASSPSFYFHFFFFSNANIGIAHNDEECRCRCEKRKMYIILSVVESKKNNIDIRVAGKNLLSRCVAAPFMPNTNGVVIILISMLDVSRPLLFYVPQSVRQNNCPDLTDCSSISIDIRIACA